MCLLSILNSCSFCRRQIKLQTLLDKVAEKEKLMAQHIENQRKAQEAAIQRAYEERVKAEMLHLTRRLAQCRRRTEQRLSTGASSEEIPADGKPTLIADVDDSVDRDRTMASPPLRTDSNSADFKTSTAPSDRPTPDGTVTAPTTTTTTRRIRARLSRRHSDVGGSKDFSREVFRMYKEQRRREKLGHSSAATEPRLATPSDLAQGTTSDQPLSSAASPRERMDTLDTQRAEAMSPIFISRGTLDCAAADMITDSIVVESMAIEDMTPVASPVSAPRRLRSACGSATLFEGTALSDADVSGLRGSDAVKERSDAIRGAAEPKAANDAAPVQSASVSVLNTADLNRATECVSPSSPAGDAPADPTTDSNGGLGTGRSRLRAFSVVDRSAKSRAETARSAMLSARRHSQPVLGQRTHSTSASPRRPRDRAMSQSISDIDVHLMLALKQHQAQLKAGAPSPRFMAVF